jgi:hypothetical protein
MGAQALLFIHHMTAGAWSFPIQRMLEASTRTIYVLGSIFLVYVVLAATGFNHNYNVWMESDNPLITAKDWYLNTPQWTMRSFAYILIAMFMANRFSAWSKQLDDTGDALIIVKFRRRAPVALLVYCVIMTFAPLDWVMSIEPLWFSTIYGPLFAISQALTLLTIFVLILERLAQEKPMAAIVQVESYHMLSTFMFVFTVMWGYMSFSQFLIIWSGNLPEEIPYYLTRNTRFYLGLTIILIVGHFSIPFMGLMQKHRMKNKIGRLKLMCYFMFAMRLCDLFYTINPAFHPKEIAADVPGPWLEVFAYGSMALGFVAFWLFLFIGQLNKMNLMPKNDPRMYAALPHVNEEMFENV